MTTAAATADEIRKLALELATTGTADPSDAVTKLVETAGHDRALLEQARDRVARGLHGHAGDWTATGALNLLNKAIVTVGWQDKYDWRVRWGQPFRRP